MLRKLDRGIDFSKRNKNNLILRMFIFVHSHLIWYEKQRWTAYICLCLCLHRWTDKMLVVNSYFALVRVFIDFYNYLTNNLHDTQSTILVIFFFYNIASYVYVSNLVGLILHSRWWFFFRIERYVTVVVSSSD